VPQDTAAERVKKLMSIQQKISLEFNQSFVGSVVDVIVDETQNKGKATGRMLCDAPEIDNIVHLSGAYDVIAGDICKALIKRVSEYELYADVCKSQKVTE